MSELDEKEIGRLHMELGEKTGRILVLEAEIKRLRKRTGKLEEAMREITKLCVTESIEGRGLQND